MVTLCSTDIIWENKEANFKELESLFSQFDFKPELIILPEMFTTGFTMDTSFAEPANGGVTLDWMRRIASAMDAAVVGSFQVETRPASVEISDFRKGKTVSNRLYFVCPDGSYEFYDKRHLFRMGEENRHYQPGSRRVIVEYKGVRFLLNICYDLRFPVWTRNVDNEYDVIINVANFPAPRVKVIEPLCKARAIENLSYMLFVNRTGADPVLGYLPSSHAIDFKGDDIGVDVAQDFASKCLFGGNLQVINAEIDLDSLRRFRERFPAWMDGDNFVICD